MDEAKSMLTVGKYNENIVNLQGVCFDMPDGCNLENVRTFCNYLVFRMKSLILFFFNYCNQNDDSYLFDHVVFPRT